MVRPFGPNEDWPHQLFSTKVEHQYSSGRETNKSVKGGPRGLGGHCKSRIGVKTTDTLNEDDVYTCKDFDGCIFCAPRSGADPSIGQG